MICVCCKSYVDVNRNHVWRLELRDTEPGSDTSYLMLGAALCQECAMSVADSVKTGKAQKAIEANEICFELVSPLGKGNHD